MMNDDDDDISVGKGIVRNVYKMIWKNKLF